MGKNWLFRAAAAITTSYIFIALFVSFSPVHSCMGGTFLIVLHLIARMNVRAFASHGSTIDLLPIKRDKETTFICRSCLKYIKHKEKFIYVVTLYRTCDVISVNLGVSILDAEIWNENRTEREKLINMIRHKYIRTNLMYTQEFA